jgi:hypothetical protein
MLHKNYDRNGSVEKKILVVNLKGFGAKTNWLAVNHQSQSDSDSLTLNEDSLQWIRGVRIAYKILVWDPLGSRSLANPGRYEDAVNTLFGNWEVRMRGGWKRLLMLFRSGCQRCWT